MAPQGLECASGWTAFQVAGKLEFSATGILAGILNPLAAAGISIFAISTFDTDYTLVRTAMPAMATSVLGKHFALIA